MDTAEQKASTIDETNWIPFIIAFCVILLVFIRIYENKEFHEKLLHPPRMMAVFSHHWTPPKRARYIIEWDQEAFAWYNSFNNHLRIFFGEEPYARFQTKHFAMPINPSLDPSLMIAGFRQNFYGYITVKNIELKRNPKFVGYE